MCVAGVGGTVCAVLTCILVQGGNEEAFISTLLAHGPPSIPPKGSGNNKKEHSALRKRRNEQTTSGEQVLVSKLRKNGCRCCTLPHVALLNKLQARWMAPAPSIS